MAACTLRIDIDEPTRARIGGEPVSGTVVVNTDNEVQCKALTVICNWGTHGRGNIASGEVETKTLYQGAWQPGQEYSYPFSLTTASWPPTYYGHHLNVSHYVEARAEIPWAVDPKTAEEFRVVATETPDSLVPVNNKVQRSNWIGWLVGVVIVALLLTAVVPLALIAMPIAVIGFGGYWFFFTFLPRRITGDVLLSVEPAALMPEQSIAGTCEFTPKWNTTINGVTWTVRCAEVCISGSGSNRTTHIHEVLSKTHQLMQPGPLRAGELKKFQFSFEIPALAPPSMTFTDNNLAWNSELRIDIPNWPDWAKKIPFVVKVAPPRLSESSAVADVNAVAASADDEDPWLNEVLQQVIQSQEEPERLEAVLDAVKDQAFALTVDLQGEVEEPYEADIDDEGSWVAATDPRRNARLVLFVPVDIDAKSIQWVRHWPCSAVVVGFESETQRVIMRLLGNVEQGQSLQADLPS